MSLPALLAEIPYPRIDPILFGPIRWYGLSYIAAFGLAYLVLKSLARRGRWPVHPDKVADVLFWGILGVFLGGRIGYMAFYAEDKAVGEWFNFRQGGMSFHGGLIGVVSAYFIYAIVNKLRFRDLGDGLALATPLGIASVRLANFINAELWGRPWDGPFAMRFPVYKIGETWDGRWDSVLRHPSQLYQALLEGLLLFFVLRFLMLKRAWGGGRVGCAFLAGYGAFRFIAEYFREPDPQLGYELLGLTRGQEFCAAMVVLGLICFALLRESRPMPIAPWAAGAAAGTPGTPGTPGAGMGA